MLSLWVNSDTLCAVVCLRCKEQTGRVLIPMLNLWSSMLVPALVCCSLSASAVKTALEQIGDCLRSITP